MKYQNSITNKQLDESKKNRLKKETQNKKNQSINNSQISKNLPIDFEDEVVEGNQLKIDSLNSENDI